MKDDSNVGVFATLIWFIVCLFSLVCYIVNIVELINCDFQGPYKDEIIHIIGVLVPPTSLITVWF